MCKCNKTNSDKGSEDHVEVSWVFTLRYSESEWTVLSERGSCRVDQLTSELSLVPLGSLCPDPWSRDGRVSELRCTAMRSFQTRFGWGAGGCGLLLGLVAGGLVVGLPVWGSPERFPFFPTSLHLIEVTPVLWWRDEKTPLRMSSSCGDSVSWAICKRPVVSTAPLVWTGRTA